MLGHWLGCIPCWVISWDVFHVGSLVVSVFHVGLLVGMYSMLGYWLLGHWLSCLPQLVIGYWFIPCLDIGIPGLVIGCGSISCWVIGRDVLHGGLLVVDVFVWGVLHVGSLVGMYCMLSH